MSGSKMQPPVTGPRPHIKISHKNPPQDNTNSVKFRSHFNDIYLVESYKMGGFYYVN